MAYIENFAIDYDKAYSMIKGLDGSYSNSIRNLRWELYRGSTRIDRDFRTIPNGVTATTAIKWSGLDPDTRYVVWATISNINGGSYPDVTLQQSFWTDEAPLPKISTPALDTSYTQKTNSTISVRAYPETGADTFFFEIWNYAKTSKIGYDSSSSSNRYAYFGGLSAGKQYQIRVYAYGSGWEDSNWSSWYVATTTAVSGWDWWHSTLPTDPIKLKRTEWIAFQNKINEIRVAKGYSAYPFSTSGVLVGSPIKAWHFNDAINAINEMLTSNMSLVYVGQPIKSSKMIEMKDKLNSAI